MSHVDMEHRCTNHDVQHIPNIGQSYIFRPGVSIALEIDRRLPFCAVNKVQHWRRRKRCPVGTFAGAV